MSLLSLCLIAGIEGGYFVFSDSLFQAWPNGVHASCNYQKR